MDTVIVAPPSLLDYWESEFKKWQPVEMNVPLIKISSNKEAFIGDRLRFLRGSRILIVSANAFHELIKPLQRLINCELMIIDEGHKAKNVETSLRKAIKEFQSKRQKIILTGTPI